MPSLLVTIDSIRIVLRKARKSTPFRALIEYCMIEWLRDNFPYANVELFLLTPPCTWVVPVASRKRLPAYWRV